MDTQTIAQAFADAFNAGGTRYSQWIEFKMFPRFRPLGWLLEPLVARQMAREFDNITAGIKQIVEREQAVASETQQ